MSKKHEGEIMYGAHPVVMEDGRLLCYSCYQDDDTAELSFWLPYQTDNFPCECETCGLKMYHEDQEPVSK